MESRGCISRLCSAGDHVCGGFNLAQPALHNLGFTQVSTIPGMKSLSCYHTQTFNSGNFCWKLAGALLSNSGMQLLSCHSQFILSRKCDHDSVYTFGKLLAGIIY